MKLLIVIVLVFCPKAEAYNSGAPTSVCTSMDPAGSAMTSSAAQTSTSPYMLNVSLYTITAGQSISGLFRFFYTNFHFQTEDLIFLFILLE